MARYIGRCVVFTTNRAVAAPVVVALGEAPSSRLANARRPSTDQQRPCANAATGAAGMQVARDMAGATLAEAVGCGVQHVLLASNGVIGVSLDIAKIRAGVTGGLAGPFH